ncbi:hypothetical protein [Sinimarinibacterium flocculans]|jgi:hypothetical protein|uniref:Antitoxin VbhA domain-containing protein n=1 Tax=Sinimarinibacterium flocculans TaxID=985250 RepID=A0A318EC70_9GAMM|nr:hypothetical protein [Sinimarinibacterium flocculans]PXV67254.1 hypothetical protein C8D93_106232 [Sinimarinibacterium flocculans]
MTQNSNTNPEGARAAALAAAERSNLREGLPPASPVVRVLDAKLIRGELTYDQAIEILGKHYRDGVPASEFGLGSALAEIGETHGGVELEPMRRDEPMRIADLP